MYTVHKSVQSDMYSVFTELSDMGYEGIEFYGEPVFDLDVLKRSITDSKLVLTGWHVEWRTGNCIEGGDDPMRILKKYKNREMLLHLKPYSYVNGFDTIIGAQDDANDWKAILDPVNKEYSWLLVESENEQLPEMKNAQLCIQGMKKYIAGDQSCL